MEIPRFIDFGVVAISETGTRVLTLRNTVPLDYEFKVKTLTYSPDVYVFPESGKVPGDSSCNITVTFSPISFCTVSADFEISFSNSSAVKRFSVIGCSQPPVFVPVIAPNLVPEPVEMKAQRKSPRRFHIA